MLIVHGSDANPPDRPHMVFEIQWMTPDVVNRGDPPPGDSGTRSRRISQPKATDVDADRRKHQETALQYLEALRRTAPASQ